MIAAKRGEWAQACADYPDLSPFTLLKLSMVRYGAELSRGALERLRHPLRGPSPRPGPARPHPAAGRLLCLHQLRGAL